MFTLYCPGANSRWIDEIKQILQWIEMHAKFLVSTAIVLSSISFYSYCLAEGLSINLIGFNFISKIPTIFTLICFITLSLIFIFISPTILVLEMIRRKDNKQELILNNLKTRRWLLLTYLTPAIVFSAMMLADYFFKWKRHDLLPIISFLLSISVFCFFGYLIQIKTGIKPKLIDTCFLAGLLQSITAITVYLLMGYYLRDEYIYFIKIVYLIES